MNKFGTHATAVVFAVVLTSLATVSAQSTPAAPRKEPERWNVIYPLVVWMPLFGVDVTLPPASPCTGCPQEIPSGSGSSAGLSGAWFGGLRLERGRFAALANYNYAGLTAKRDSPFFSASVKITMATVMGGVRVHGPLFVEGGARYHGLNASFTVRTFPTVNWRPGQWAPAIGAGFRTALRDDWRLYAHVDWSGFDLNDLSTTNAEAHLEWRPWAHFGVTFGYGFGRARWNGEIGGYAIKMRETLHGPIIGVGIPF